MEIHTIIILNNCILSKTPITINDTRNIRYTDINDLELAKQLKSVFGIYLKDQLNKKPIYYAIDTVSEPIKDHKIAEFNLRLLKTILHFIWQVKDHSIDPFITITFSKNSKTIYQIPNDIITSNSVCATLPTKISQEDIDKSLMYFSIYNEHSINRYKDQSTYSFLNDYAPNFMNYNPVIGSRLNQIEKCFDLLVKTRNAHTLEFKISLYITLLEQLFKYTKHRSVKLSQYISRYIGKTTLEINRIQHVVYESYQIRSNFVHGRPNSEILVKQFINGIPYKILEKRVLNIELLQQYSSQLDDICRKCLSNIFLKDIILLNNNSLHKAIENKH